MPKTSITLAPDLSPDRPRPRRWGLIGSIALLAVLASPLLIDSVAVCYGRWSEMLGRPVDVRTPTFDAIADRTADGREWLWYQTSSFFHRVPWNPRVVVPVSVAVMVLAMAMIRR